MKHSWLKVVLRKGLNRFKTNISILQLELQTGDNKILKGWAKAEFNTGQ